MILKSIMLAFGFMPAGQSHEMRQMRAAAEHHAHANVKAQTSALDIIDRQQSEPQTADLSRSPDRIESLLSKMLRNELQ